jgi:hypothetical protein
LTAPAAVGGGSVETAAADRAWLTRPAPAARLAVFRILVGVYSVGWLLARLPAHLSRPPVGFHAVGVLWWLESPPGAVESLLAVATPVVGIAFVAGWRFRVTGPLFAAGLTVLATLDSSWGQIFHTEDLMVLHVLIVAFAPAADALAVDAKGRAVPEPHGRYGWPLRLAMLVVVVTYFVAGVAKVRIAGASWVSGDTLRNLVAEDNLRKAVLGDRSSPIGQRLAAHVTVFQVFAVASLAVELGAPLALLGRRAAVVWAACAWMFHIGVMAVMAVFFPYHLSFIAYAPFFELERLPAFVARLRPRRRRGG